MQRIRFTCEDLARTKIMATVGKAGETLFALDVLARGAGGSLYGPWRAAVRGRLANHPRSLSLIARNIRAVPDILSIVGTETEMDGPRTGHGQRLAEMVRDFYRVVLAPYWPRVLSHLETEREIRGRMLFTGGFDQLFATLHPRIRWEPPVLSVPGEPDQDIELDSRGLRVAPSLFLLDRPRLLRLGHGDGAPVLVYPAPPSATQAATLWQVDGDDGSRALAALVGRTRAAMLRALAEACTSNELGRLLGISSAAVSQHTTVLRDAGLIASQRKANHVSHIVTPLGATLLQGPILGFRKGVTSAAGDATRARRDETVCDGI